MKLASKRTLQLFLLASAIYINGCDQDSQTPNYDQILIQAQSYLSSGQIQSAILESQNLIQIDPKATDSFILLGNIFSTVGDYKNAAINYQKAINLGLTPSKLRFIQYQRIDTLIRLGRLKDAQTELTALPTLESSDATLLRLKGDIALTQGIYNNATLLYKQALTLQPQQSDSLLGLAVATHALGDLEATTDWLNQALESKSPFIDALIFQGYFFLDQKKADQAETSFSAALAALGKFDVMTSKKYKTIQGLAKSLIDQGRTDDALKLNKTLADSPQGKVQQSIKNALQSYQQGDIAAAEKSFEEVLSVAPHHQLSNLGLGMLKLQEGDIKTAEHLLSQATQDLDGLNEKAFKALTLARLKLGKTEAALDILKKGLIRFPESADLHLLQASALTSSERYDSATSILNTLLKNDPQNPDALNLMAHIYQKKGQLHQARENYIKSIKKRPEFFPTYKGLFASYQQQPREAQKQIQIILSQQNPHVLMTEVALGISHMLNKDFLSARDLARKLQKKEPNNTQIKYLLSSALYATALEDYKKQRLQPAYIQLKEAAEILPTEQNITLLTRLSVELQRPDEAVQVIQDIIDSTPTFSLGSELLGDLAMASNKKTKAIQHLEKAWSISPSFRLAIKLFKLKKTHMSLTGALTHIEQWHNETEFALQNNPNNTTLQKTLESSLFALATAYEQHKQHEKAIHKYAKLIELKPESPLYLNNIAWLKFIENQSDAIHFAKKAYSLAPDTGEIIDTYAWILVQKGETKKGIELLKVAIEKSPNNTMIKQHLEQATQMQSKSI